MENKDEIRNELKDVAPVLAALERKHPFKVPDGYFDALEKSILAGVSMEMNEDVMAFEMRKLISAKEHPFEVPQDYFEKLPEKILQRIHAEKNIPAAKSNAIVRSIAVHYRVWLVAASVAVVTGMLFLFQPKPILNPASPDALAMFQTSHEEQTVSPTENYLMANLAEVDEATIESVMNESTETDGAVNAEDNTNQNDEVPYENYLMDATDIDPEIITGI